MAVEESLRSKTLYKAEILLLKIIPMLLALVYLSNTVISYFFDLDLIIFSYVGSVSILSLGFLYLSSYVFRFCEYHRIFLHYVLINELLNTYDTHIGVPLEDREFFCVHLIIIGISLFLILYLYAKSSKRTNS